MVRPSAGSAPVVWVTGGSGLLGRHVTRLAAAAGWFVAAPDSRSVDVADRDAVHGAVGGCAPDAVVHLAYRQHDRDVIVDGTAHVAEAAAAVGARLVHLSTDVVFGGGPTPYGEDAPVAPITDYGRWKAEAEELAADRCPGSVLVRTSLLYATDGLAPCQRDVLDVLDGRRAMRFFTDEVRCPTHVEDVAAAVVALAGDRGVVGPLHVAGPEPLDRASFARLIARWLGRSDADVPTATIAATGAVRPGRVVLDSSRAAAFGITCRRAAAALPAGAWPVRPRSS